MSRIIEELEKSQYRTLPSFRIGDQVRVGVRIIEGDSERVQVFEGTVTRMRGHGLSSTFTVRKVSYGVGVERIFPFHSPRLESLQVVRSGHVRRAKLYFLRKRSGKLARLDEKIENREVEQPASAAAPAAPAPAAASSAKPAKAPAAAKA